MRSSMLITSLIGVITVIAGCGGDQMSGPDSSTGPDTIVVSPAAAPPGSVVSIRGMGEDMNPANLQALVDNQSAPIVVSESGQLLIAVPLSAAGSDGQSPPSEPVDVEILRDGERVGFGEGVLSIFALPKAPGSTDALHRELDALAGGLSAVFDDLHPQPTEAEGYAFAVVDAVDEILNGDGPESLQSQLQSLSDADREFLDGFLASSGILEQTQQLAASMGALASAAELRGSEGSSMGDLVSDQELARRMQFQVIAQLFGQTVVNETAEAYATTVGLATGAAGLVTTVPAAAVISAILAVVDFSVNKILLGLMPAQITNFELTLEDNTLVMSETTAAKVEITAVNTPPAVGIQDFVGLTLNLLGLGSTPEAQAFKDVLLDTAAFFLGTIQAGLASYSNEHPELNLDVSFSLVPVLEWEAVIHDPRLVECVSLTPELIVGLNEEVNWTAAPDKIGEGKIYARIATGPESILLDLPPGFEYTGGAFGEEVKATETKTVLIGGELEVEVDFASTIAYDGINALEVRAGYEGADEEIVWVEGLQVQLIIDGGQVEELTGTTDEDGQFITLVQPLPESEEVIITVTVSDELGQSEDKTVSATVAGSKAVVNILDRGYLITESDFFCGVGEYGPGWAPEMQTDRVRDVVNVDGVGSYESTVTIGGELSHPNGDQASAQAQVSSNLNIQATPGGSTLAVISATTQYSTQATATRNEGSNSANAEAEIERIHVKFEVVGGPVQYDFTSTFNGTPGNIVLFGEYQYVASEGELVSPQLSGTLDEGEYQIYISQARCGIGSTTQQSCSGGYEFELVLTSP